MWQTRYGVIDLYRWRPRDIAATQSQKNKERKGIPTMGMFAKAPILNVLSGYQVVVVNRRSSSGTSLLNPVENLYWVSIVKNAGVSMRNKYKKRTILEEPFYQRAIASSFNYT